ncbi:MAG: Hydrogenase maturation protein HypF [Ignavibacteria bacterium]|nr:Hydrogenase maturation protein HypF [Ignavibacteria bacterium]
MLNRLQISIIGTLPKSNFSEFLIALAEGFKLAGSAQFADNSVEIDIEGEKADLDMFITGIMNNKPSSTYITTLEYLYLDIKKYKKFEITESKQNGYETSIILPDIAICPDCLREMNDPKDRRYKYPFINCSHCGPRFSIIESMPLERQNTSMREFDMCPLCQAEYDNQGGRRFKAPALACPVCGPRLEVLSKKGSVLSVNNNAIKNCTKALLEGLIIAMKGFGGFQLLVDARNDSAVKRLREKMEHDEKPYTVIFPNLQSVYEYCELSTVEQNLLNAPEAPVTILRKNKKPEIYLSKLIAPDNPYLNVLLPYSPLHNLLIQRAKIPLIAADGNLSEGQVCIENSEALKMFSGIADYFLVHNLPLRHHSEDSIVRAIAGRKTIIRRARGYTTLPVNINFISDEYNRPALALGADTQNAIAIKKNNNCLISPQISQLPIQQSNETFHSFIDDFTNFCQIQPDLIICDPNPNYYTSNFAKKNKLEKFYVQHNIAHILSCRAENRVHGKSLGISWDSAGYGLDGNIWGGEFFICIDDRIRHVAQMRKFPLPGGEIGLKDIRRAALGILYEIYGDFIFDNNSMFDRLILNNFDKKELTILKHMLEHKSNTPMTSSIGSLFDAVAVLLGLKTQSSFEGQAAMALEFAANPAITDFYNYSVNKGSILVIDWEKIIREIIDDIRYKIPTSSIAAKFHNTLVLIIESLAGYFFQNKVILSGGCFQNVLLTEKTIETLEAKHIIVYRHQLVPPNDSGIALGQVAAMGYKFIF